MRIPALVRFLLLFIALLSPAFLRAQFQQPSDEELKMTSDPKAPGAAAVYLDIQENTNANLHFQSVYARIKVLTEKGKELATVEVPYLQGDTTVTDIKARTIHSDGTVIPLVGKPEDLLIVKSKSKNGEQFQVDRKVFTLPSVEVGSILEYRYEIRIDDHLYTSPSWEIQRPYFVHKAHYYFLPFKAFLPGLQNMTSSYLIDNRGRQLNTLIWWPKLPKGVTVKDDVAGSYTVDVTDVPPAPQEEWMPPRDSYLYRVIFYYKNATSASDFWITESKLWSKDVDHFAEPTKSIKDAVAGIVAPTDSELDKARKLYKAVQDLDNTDYSRKKSESERKELKLKTIKRAEDTWTQKSGDREDIALLYLAMLRAAGLNANAMKVVDRERSVFDTAYLNFNQLDDTIILLNTGGKDIVLDPGEKMCPFQTVNWRHSSAGGVKQTAKGPVPDSSQFQTYVDNKTLRIGEVTLDANGALTGSFRFVMTGQEALKWRQKAIRNDIDEVKKQFDKSIESIFPEGVEAHIDNFTGLDDPDANLIATIKATGNLGSATSKRLILPGFFFDTRGAASFVAQEKRELPVDMQYGSMVTDQITYKLPEGFSVEGAPQDAKLMWPDHAALIVKTVPGDGKITIARQLARNFTFIMPNEYQDLRSFYQKIAASDQGQLVLTHSAAAKGN
jgi:hypothetical protein